MLFVSQPFVPIYRIHAAIPKNMMRCECWDIGTGRLIIYTLEWDHISSDDGAELARTQLDPSSYQPSKEEFRWWIDTNA